MKPKKGFIFKIDEDIDPGMNEGKTCARKSPRSIRGLESIIEMDTYGRSC